MNRRKFVKSSVIGGAGLVVVPSLFSFSDQNTEDSDVITILHTNDTHSNIDAFDASHSKYPGRGGVAKRFSIIEKIRKESAHVLLLDAGDIFQGTPYFNKYGGVLEMKLMSELGYDCATLGNHDFDGGMDGFLKAKKQANFPFVNVNYDFSNTPLNNEISKYQVFNKGKFKVGVFGVGVELEGLVSKDLCKDVLYANPIRKANETAAFLRKEMKCDLVICLSHLGYSYDSNKVSDLVLAKETMDIDLIIGGHTHTFLNEPIAVRNKVEQTVLINQVGWAGLNLGRIDFYLGKSLKNNKYQNFEL